MIGRGMWVEALGSRWVLELTSVLGCWVGGSGLLGWDGVQRVMGSMLPRLIASNLSSSDGVGEATCVEHRGGRLVNARRLSTCMSENSVS